MAAYSQQGPYRQPAPRAPYRQPAPARAPYRQPAPQAPYNQQPAYNQQSSVPYDQQAGYGQPAAYSQQAPYNQPAAYSQQAAYNQQAARNQRPAPKQQAIQMQPMRQQQNPVRQNQRYVCDQDGEEIVFKGLCSRCGVCWDVFWHWMFILVPFVVGIVIGCPIATCCGIKAIKEWRLHVTRTSVKYKSPTGIGCCDKNWVIPFCDIEDIFVCRGTNDVWVRMDTRKVDAYLGCWNKPLCKKNCLVLSNVSNGHEFVTAVKRQMQMA